MSADEISVAVIGAGMAGRAHANGYRQASTVFGGLPVKIRLAAIADANFPLAQEAANLYGFDEAYDSWEQVAADPTIDAVSVVVGNNLHRTVAEGFLAAGKHVLCEKPLSDSIDDAKAMVDAARSSGRVASIAYSRRLVPTFAAIRRHIDNGDLGELTDFRGHYWCNYAGNPLSPWSWRDSGALGSGCLADIGAHIIDLAELLCGEITQVSGADLNTSIKERFVALGATVGHGLAELSDEKRPVTNEDSASFTVKFSSGVPGSFSISRVAFGDDDGVGFTIAGLKGSITFDWRRPSEYKINREATDGAHGDQTIVAGPDLPYYQGGLAWNAPGLGYGYSDIFVFQCRAFLDEIIGQESELPALGDFARGLHTMEVIEAIVESSRSGQRVEVR